MPRPSLFGLITTLCLLFALSTVTQAQDTDSDGIDNDQERIDGTNAADPDSRIVPNTDEYCVEWNGYLSNLAQIAEFRNAGCASDTVSLKLRGIDGAVRSSLEFDIEPGIQRDVILNTLEGFEASSYGLVCATILSGISGSLDAQLAVYSLSDQSFSFAFASPHHAPGTGTQLLAYNHYYPTLLWSELSNLTTGYVQISNYETTSESGELVFYNDEGIEQRRVNVNLPAKGRADVATHELGRDTVGLIEWIPTSATAEFRVVLNRYYFSSPVATSPLKAAVSITSRPASGHLLATPFSTESRIAALELSNSLGSGTNVSVSVFSADGQALSQQTVLLPAKGTRHLLLNQILPSGRGKVSLDAGAAGSLVANLFEYGLDDKLGLKFASAGEPSAGFGKYLKSSYNNFLGACRLLLANISHSQSTVTIGATRYDGTPISIAASPATIPADATVEVDICSNETVTGYGDITLTPNAAERIAGYLVRESTGGAELLTNLRERSICLAQISVSGSPLVLATNGSPGTLTLTNTSQTITATNLVPDFTGTALDGNVTATQNSCASLAPLASCTIGITPGSTVVSQTGFRIYGDNVKAVSAQARVDSTTTTISVSPILLLIAEHSAGSFTVTNTGSSLAATNVAATIPGGSGLSIQSTTCGASLVPGVSCTITIASSTLEGPTTVSVAGGNTNTATVDVGVTDQPLIAITGPSQASRIVSTDGFTTLDLAVTNDSNSVFNANNITVTDKSACPNLSVDASNCTSVAPGASCLLALTTTTPYAPCLITIGGINTGNTPQTLIAFSHLGGIVFEKSGVNGKVVIDAGSEFTSEWTFPSSSDVPGAMSDSDGASNTNAIVVHPACSNQTSNCAAFRCRTISADWYLPARNELGSIQGALCSNGTIPCNYGAFSSTFYWSSTQWFAATNAYGVDFPSGNFGPGSKFNSLPVRCVRAF